MRSALFVALIVATRYSHSQSGESGRYQIDLSDRIRTRKHSIHRRLASVRD